MKPDELKKIIDTTKEHGLNRSVLFIEKPKGFKLRGFKIRTPFGNCEVYNVQEKEYSVSIVFCVALKDLVKYYNKMMRSVDE